MLKEAVASWKLLRIALTLILWVPVNVFDVV